MTVEQLEQKVWVQDGVRIVIRAALNTKVKDYTQKNAAQANWSATEFLRKRITPLLKGLEVVLLQGDGEQPHGRTLLSSIRTKYHSA